jgi:hypothetical protein
MSKWTPPAGTKIVMPSILITSPEFVPTRGADVQATWRKRGWKPTFGNAHLTEEPKPIDSKVLKLWKQS